MIIHLWVLGLSAKEIPRFHYSSSILKDTDIKNQERINTQWDDYAPIPILGEKYLIFQSQRPGAFEEHSLWYSLNRNFQDPSLPPIWSDPLPLVFPLDPSKQTKTMKVIQQYSFTVNSDAFVGHPSILIINHKIKEIYFTSHKSQSWGGFANLNIYYTSFSNDRWSKIQHIDEINSHFDDLMPFITKDGKKLFFVSNRPGGYGGFDIWYAERELKTGKWSKPVNLGPSINTEFNEITPFLTAKGQKLIFASDRPGGIGKYDLYVSNYNGLSFDLPLNLGKPFNSEENDEFLRITDNSLWTYMASDRIHTYAKGGYDIYRFLIPRQLIEFVKILLKGKILDAHTEKPVGLEATIRIDFGEQTLILKSDRKFKNDGSTVENHFRTELFTGRIYRIVVSAPGYYPAEILLDLKEIITQKKVMERTFYLEPIRKIPEIERYIPGIVIDAETHLSLPGSKVIKLDSMGKITELKLDEFAQFQVPVRKKEKFEIQASSPGYESGVFHFQESRELKKIIIRLRKVQEPCEAKQLECIWNTRIFFELDSAEVSKKELEKIRLIAEILQLYPSVRIEIQGHTDLSYRGPKEKSYEYNLRLSIQRANNVKKKLEELGIQKDRMVVKGFSYTKPLVPVPDPVRGAINRRVEFKQIK